MAHLKYYEDEEKRWPELNRIRCSESEANEAIRAWSSTHTPGHAPPVVVYTSGNRISHAYARRIVLNRDCLDWLLVAHEFAHVWQDRDSRQPKRVWHDSEHAERVDILCRSIIREGWDRQGLAETLARRENARRDRAAAKPPPPSPRQLKIMRRREQVARLGRKVKALTTRLKTAQRSLRALERLEGEAK